MGYHTGPARQGCLSASPRFLSSLGLLRKPFNAGRQDIAFWKKLYAEFIWPNIGLPAKQAGNYWGGPADKPCTSEQVKHFLPINEFTNTNKKQRCIRRMAWMAGIISRVSFVAMQYSALSF